MLLTPTCPYSPIRQKVIERLRLNNFFRIPTTCYITSDSDSTQNYLSNEGSYHYVWKIFRRDETIVWLAGGPFKQWQVAEWLWGQ